MKKINLFHGLVVVLLCTTTLCSCLSDIFDDGREVLSSKVVVLNISHELVSVGVRPPGTTDDKVSLMECVVDGTNETFYISPNRIDGFGYEEGYIYKVRVRVMDIAAPPADGYTEKYELIEIISKEKVK